MSAINRLKKLWKVRKTLFQMCNDRGYKVSHLDLGEDLSEFVEHFHDRTLPDSEMDVSFGHTDADKGRLWVFFLVNDRNMNFTYIEGLLKKVEEVPSPSSRAILVVPTQEAIDAFALKDVDSLLPRCAFEIFTESELLVNCTKFKIVPEFTVLSTAEADEILHYYRSKSYHLPRILSTDPVSRYLGLRSGQVVKAIARNAVGSRYVTYQCVS